MFGPWLILPSLEVSVGMGVRLCVRSVEQQDSQENWFFPSVIGKPIVGSDIAYALQPFLMILLFPHPEKPTTATVISDLLGI